MAAPNSARQTNTRAAERLGEPCALRTPYRYLMEINKPTTV